jgi:hypothetical protein
MHLATKPAILILIATQVARAPFGEFEACLKFKDGYFK